MINVKNIRMPVGSEVETTASKTHVCWIIGFNQQKGLHILLEDGSIQTFYKDQIKRITSRNPGFPCKGQQIMRIKAEQSQQWGQDLPVFDALGQEIKFDSGPTKQALDQAEKEIHKPTKNPPRQKTAASHWIGMQ